MNQRQIFKPYLRRCNFLSGVTDTVRPLCSKWSKAGCALSTKRENKHPQHHNFQLCPWLDLQYSSWSHEIMKSRSFQLKTQVLYEMPNCREHVKRRPISSYCFKKSKLWLFFLVRCPFVLQISQQVASQKDRAEQWKNHLTQLDFTKIKRK